MGEIIYSLFIGGCVVAVGLLMNGILYREERRNVMDKDKTRQEG